MQGQTMQDTAHQHIRQDVAPVCNPYQAAHAGQIWTAAGCGGRGVCPKLCKSGQAKTPKINTQKNVNTY